MSVYYNGRELVEMKCMVFADSEGEGPVPLSEGIILPLSPEQASELFDPVEQTPTP